ncbi:MAG: hypothetical protein ACRDQB_03390, partial [Thermocrispum sp.]
MRRRTRWGAAIVGVTAMLVAAAPAGGGQVADPGPPEEVSSGWTVPWEIAWAPDGSFALVT